MLFYVCNRVACHIEFKNLPFNQRPINGWLYADFHSWLKFQLGIPSWKKLQLFEKFQSGLKIFQPDLKYNGLEKLVNLDGSWNEKRKKVNERKLNWKSSIYLSRHFRLDISV